jgi:hypothetical protein
VIRTASAQFTAKYARLSINGGEGIELASMVAQYSGEPDEFSAALPSLLTLGFFAPHYIVISRGAIVWCDLHFKEFSGSARCMLRYSFPARLHVVDEDHTGRATAIEAEPRGAITVEHIR